MNEISMSSDLIDLKMRGYLLNDVRTAKYAENMIFDREKVNALFRADDSLFWEFFSTYPIKVPGRNGGSRILRSVGLDAKETLKMKKKYESIVKDNVVLHKHILKCLDAELFVRRKDNSLQFMKGIEPYLNQQAWTRYEDTLETMTVTKNKPKYGQKLI
jgi:hypothetical protein